MSERRRRKAGPRTRAHRALLAANRHHYDALLALQGGGCAICGKPPNPERRHCLDHDHQTMEIRGVLCTTCNRRLSNRITAEWLLTAAMYLRNPPMKELS